MNDIRIKMYGQEFRALLDDNAAARYFLALLPLSLTLTDYANTEKVSPLPAPLSLDGVPEGSGASVGDLAHYAPWGNLAIFTRDFGYAKGLVRLGRIVSNFDPGSLQGESPARIERIYSR